MSHFKPQQRHIEIDGRRLHFVSYEEREANARREEEACPAMWFLMAGAHRCPALPYDADQPLEAVDEELRSWALINAMGAAPATLPNGRRATPADAGIWEE